jgi:hypothetical protein
VTAVWRMVWVIGAEARLAAGDGARPVGSLRAMFAVVATWWRSRGSGPLNSPIWSQTT